MYCEYNYSLVLFFALYNMVFTLPQSVSYGWCFRNVNSFQACSLYIIFLDIIFVIWCFFLYINRI